MGAENVSRRAARIVSRMAALAMRHPAPAGEGCRRRGEGRPTQGLRPGLRYDAPLGLSNYRSWSANL